MQIHSAQFATKNTAAATFLNILVWFLLWQVHITSAYNIFKEKFVWHLRKVIEIAKSRPNFNRIFTLFGNIITASLYC